MTIPFVLLEYGCVWTSRQVRSQFRKIFTQMGFEEMPSNAYVESSFWNFDALFQPQQHPARDAHDTFFLTKPASSGGFPDDYLQRVKETHEKGGFDSIGYVIHEFGDGVEVHSGMATPGSWQRLKRIC